MEEEKIRINKYLSEIGFCSRRAADKLIDEGKISVNGNTLEKGLRVSDEDEIRVNGELVKNKNDQRLYIAFNKPVGIVCTTDTRVERDNIVDYINHPKRIFPIGRLDKPSEGLIFLTNDGDIVNKILRARNNHEKEYIVNVNKAITDDFLRQMRSGVPILDTVTKECVVEQTGNRQFKIILTQGLNRQIRRMCKYLGYSVMRLQRVRIMNIKLDVPVGEWRYLTKTEMKELNDLLIDSKKVHQ